MHLLRTYIFCLILSYAFAFVISIVSGNSFLISTGDFPAFYSSAFIMRHDHEHLYDFKLQEEIQNIFWKKTLNQGYYPYVYPPFYSFILIPLTYLGPEFAKLFYVFIMSIFMVLSIQMHKEDINSVSKGVPFWMKLSYFFLLPPNLIAILSGQNTALSLLIIAVFVKLYSEGTSLSEFLSGVCLGLLAYKPHFVLLFIIFVCFLRKNKVIFGILLTLFLLFVLNAYLMHSWLWPIQYIKMLSLYQVEENSYNLLKQISIFSTLEYFGMSGNIFIIVYICFTFSIIFSFTKFWRNRLNKEWSEWKYILVTLPLVVLLTPHVMYYELGLLFFPFLFINNEITRRKILALMFLPLILLLPAFSFNYLFYYQTLSIISVCALSIITLHQENKYESSNLT